MLKKREKQSSNRKKSRKFSFKKTRSRRPLKRSSGHRSHWSEKYPEPLRNWNKNKRSETRIKRIHAGAVHGEHSRKDCLRAKARPPSKNGKTGRVNCEKAKKKVKGRTACFSRSQTDGKRRGEKKGHIVIKKKNGKGPEEKRKRVGLQGPTCENRSTTSPWKKRRSEKPSVP